MSRLARFIVKCVIAVAVVVMFMVTGLGAAPAPTLAQCALPSEAGQWYNQNVNTRSITRANITFQCQDQVLNGQPYPPGAPFYIHLYGKCQPTDCDWGTVPATQTSTGWLRATLDQGFAVRQIWVKAYRPDLLRVWIWTDFRDPSRADYASDDWFHR